MPEMANSSSALDKKAAKSAYMKEYWAKPENKERRNRIRAERKRTDPEYADHVRVLQRKRNHRFMATEKGKATSRRSQATRRDRKRGVWLEDPCSYCSGKAEVRDHIVPVAQGGTDSWDNLTPACQRCNSEKGDKSLLTFLLARAA